MSFPIVKPRASVSAIKREIDRLSGFDQVKPHPAPRWGQVALDVMRGNLAVGIRQDLQAQREILAIRNAAIVQGHVDGLVRAERQKVAWTHTVLHGEVRARTKSEARAELKKLHNLGKLPPGKVVRV